MEAVEAHPADVTAAAGYARLRGRRSTSAGDLRLGASAASGAATNSRRPGRSAPGQRGRRPASVTRPGRAVSRSQASRSVRRTSSARLALAPADDVDVLVLERLVGLEEVLDLDEAVRPDLVEPLDVLLMRVADGDAQDLEVEALLVAHLEPADRAGPDVAAGERRLVDDQQRVGVIAVAARGCPR